MNTTDFFEVEQKPTYARIHIQLWRVTIHIRETDRDIALQYPTLERAQTVAKKIADKLHQKVLRRQDVVHEEVQLTHRKHETDENDPGDCEYKLVWWKKVQVQGEPKFIAMKDYVYVRETSSASVVLT